MKKYILFILLFHFNGIKAQGNLDTTFNDRTKETLTVSDKGELIISKKAPIIATYNAMFSTSYFFTRINDSIVMNLILEAPSAFTITKGDRLFFKTTKENIINLTAPDHVIIHNSKSTPSKWNATILLPISHTVYELISREKAKSFLLFPEQSYRIIMDKDEDEIIKYIKLCFLKRKRF